jgi:hypothetical protein
MFHRYACRSRRHSKWTFALSLTFLPLGCGDASGVKTVPVTGQIIVDGQPLNARNATVVFKPDQSKGNRTPYEPYGTVDQNGKYTLFVAADKQGAPAGWYKVIVVAFEAPAADLRRPGAPAKHNRLLANRKYGDPKTSTLVVEVVQKPKPDAYDLILTK